MAILKAGGGRTAMKSTKGVKPVKIERNEKNTCQLREIKNCECFVLHENVYAVTERHNDNNKTLCVRMNDLWNEYFPPETIVKPVKATLIVDYME